MKTMHILFSTETTWMLDWSRIKVSSQKPTIWDMPFKLLNNRN